MLSNGIQEMEKQDLPTVEAEIQDNSVYVIESEPQKKIVKVLSMSPIRNVSVLKDLRYGYAVKVFAKPTDKPATQTIGVVARLGNFALPNVTVTLWDLNTQQKLASGKTDENGFVKFDLKSETPGTMDVVAGIGDLFPLAPTVNPFADVQRLSYWYVVVKATPLSDRWARYIGRSLGKPLPYKFWVESPDTVLGVLGGKTTFADMFPVFGSQSFYYEIGISAYCNTTDPFPTHEECCAPENTAWWDVKVYATTSQSELEAVKKGEKGFIGGDKINLDYHLRFSFTPTSAKYLGRYLVHKRCDWEV